MLEHLVGSALSWSRRSRVCFEVPGPGVLPKAEHRCCSLGRSELGHILGEHVLGMLEVCGKCVGMLERSRIRVSNYSGGEKAERILEGWGFFTDFQVCGLLV